MAKNYYEIEKKAKLWLKDKLDEGRLVFDKSELDKLIYKYLKSNDLIVDLHSKYFFVKESDLSPHEALKLYYWRILIQFLNLRFPSSSNDPSWYLTGKYAYEFLGGSIKIPSLNEQIIIQTQSQSNTTIKLLGDYELLVIQDQNFDAKTIVKNHIYGDDLFVLKPEYLIINSNPTQYQLYEESIVSYLKQKDFDTAYVEDFFKQNSSPILQARFIGALRQINEQILRIKLERVFNDYDYKISIENPFSREYQLKKTDKPVFVTRFSLSMKKAKEVLKSIQVPKRLSKKITAIEIDKYSVEDAYHNLTIEGYDVTHELLKKIQTDYTDDVDDNLRNISASKGFMRVLNFIKSLTSINYEFNQDLTEELWKQLWSSSINAGVLKSDINVYRNHMVSIKGSNSVPPSHEKIHYLLEEFYAEANDFDNGFLQGIFLHFFYVWIHPHSDGNGRISRFLMNLAFIGDKYRWLTIPCEDKRKYFAALEKSQLTDDISYFAQYIRSLV